MSPRTLPRWAFGLGLASVTAACARGEPRREAPQQAEVPAPRAGVATGSASALAAPPPPKMHAPGDVPFEFPSQATTAKAGDFVLAPSRSWIDEAFEHGSMNQTFIYYGAWMQEPGVTASKLRTLPGQTTTIPNAMILRVSSGESAKPGDVVLTAWASGAGLERAIVVDGGSAEKPKVRYLDIDLDNPSGWGQKDDELPAKTFHVLSKPGEPGTTLACKDGERRLRYVLIARAAKKLLGLGFAGKMRVFDEPACADVPIAPKLKVGDKVWVPAAGAFVEAKVKKIDAAIGRVDVERDFGGKKQEEAVGYGNVAIGL